MSFSVVYSYVDIIRSSSAKACQTRWRGENKLF